jgi:hypothetical protein
VAASSPDDDLAKYGINISGGSTVQSSGSGLNPNSPIYMGPTANRTKNQTGYGPYSVSNSNIDYTGSETMPYGQASGLPATWDDATKRDFISKGILYKLPGFNADMGMPELMKSWGDLVDSASAISAAGGGQWSPWDVMNSYGNSDKNFGSIRKGDWLYDAATGEKLKYVGPRTKTTTDKKIDLSSAEDVKAITTQMLTELLGRAPTSDELAKYRSSINGYEKDNPLVTKTISHLDDQGEVTAQDSTSSGGASDAARQSLIQDQATKGPEYGKFQSGTTYYNALMQMLGG